ncbi:ShlB/FhaC/HecB family hemolysin secretion/activation protein [Komagataeibacter rhaeticus]|uniref:ShlB/FhaC/HecB family hemolysin secretion/activation protein n=2 Tax=Komagataeibacter rhaeticus TaxID=215221 RepID=A0A858JCR7_9PROT|nr:ShlB/FhaC/HecB family hemolysin secretion/activation protein [Komagataeibacter rhaeticus]QIP34451.1 ShlB/FhaC/HecB family hemolysin secretion/activation protein [Komagataeibacter rhaeticus]QOC46968.1 ShlB/FhaC/HecB family hemolysin secretion/activation protein [Komagataeibacter rhaeticus]
MRWQVGAAAAMMALPGVAMAQVPGLPGGVMPAGPGSSQDQFQRFEQHQEQLDALPPPSNDIQIQRPSALPQASKTCVTVHDITVEGAQHLSRATTDAITGPHVGTCMSVRDLNGLINALNAAYIRQGFITSRAYLPEQKLSSGHLRIVVIEGKLAGVQLQGRPARLATVMAFPGLHGKILNLRDLEQGIEDMNRLSHWGARMRIAPGGRAGASTVVVTAPKRGVLHGQVWFDNYGQQITGQETGHAMLTAENPLGLLDLWSVEYDHSLVGHAGQRGTSYLSVNGSIPFGYWTVFGSWWRSQDDYPLLALTDVYHLGGSRRDWRLGISRVLLRNRIGVTTFQASYERKSFGSEINHTVIDTETARQAFVNVQVSESLKGWGGVWYITGGLKVAVDGAGTWSNFTRPGWQDPHSSYLKPSLDIDGYKPLARGVLWHTTLHGEYSTRDQFPTNELQVGGPYSVRGFLEQILLGNDGGYMRNDFSWQLPTKGLKCGKFAFICHQVIEGTQLYAALDVGVVRAGFASSSTPPALKGGEMAGGGLGLRKTTGPFFWNVSLTHSMYTGPLPSEGLIPLFQVGAKI